MNALQIRNLLLKIGQELHCPVCNKKLSSAHLKIENLQGQGCQIAISCPSCRDEFKGVAQMIPMLTPHGKMLNASSVLTKDQEISASIDSNDVSSVKSALTDSLLFSKLFEEKKES